MKVLVRRFFPDVDMRPGEHLMSQIYHINRKKLKNHECCMFMNKARNILRVIARHGMYSERLPGNQTWDFRLRRHQIFAAVGRAFGISLDVPEDIYQRTSKKLLK
jgi:hypothetical protein